MSVSYFWSLWCFKFKAPFDILLIYFLLLFASASFQQTKIIHRVNNTFQTTTETSFRAQFCSQMVHLYFHVFCTTHWSFFQMPTLPATILSVTVGRVYIIWYHIGIHQIHEKMVLWKTWSHLTTKYFLILHLGHESRLCFLVTPGMLSHGAVCVMASCMPPSLTGQLYSYICIKNYCFLWLLTVFLFDFCGLLLSNLTSWKPQVHVHNICLSFWFAWFDFPRPRQWLKSDPWNGFWKYDPPPEIHLQLPAFQRRLWLLHWSDETDGPCTRYWLQLSPSESGHGATPVISFLECPLPETFFRSDTCFHFVYLAAPSSPTGSCDPPLVQWGLHLMTNMHLF